MADDYYIWTTARRIKDGTQQEFEEAWQPKDFPDGMLRAYELIEENTGEIVGVSIWDSKDSCEAYRASDVESERREAMAPYVEDERSRTYTGRELGIPDLVGRALSRPLKLGIPGVDLRFGRRADVSGRVCRAHPHQVGDVAYQAVEDLWARALRHTLDLDRLGSRRALLQQDAFDAALGLLGSKGHLGGFRPRPVRRVDRDRGRRGVHRPEVARRRAGRVVRVECLDDERVVALVYLQRDAGRAALQQRVVQAALEPDRVRRLDRELRPRLVRQRVRSFDDRCFRPLTTLDLPTVPGGLPGVPGEVGRAHGECVLAECKRPGRLCGLTQS